MQERDMYAELYRISYKLFLTGFNMNLRGVKVTTDSNIIIFLFRVKIMFDA